MSNGDAVVADDDFLDKHSDDALASQHVQTLDLSAHTREEFAQCVSEP
jgi:hypothetical protein